MQRQRDVAPMTRPDAMKRCDVEQARMMRQTFDWRAAERRPVCGRAPIETVWWTGALGAEVPPTNSLSAMQQMHTNRCVLAQTQC